MYSCVHVACIWVILLLSIPQVIEGGDLDINFMVTDPNKKSMVMEPHSMDGLHGIDIKITGEYEICLDNSFSRMTGSCKLWCRI